MEDQAMQVEQLPARASFSNRNSEVTIFHRLAMDGLTTSPIKQTVVNKQQDADAPNDLRAVSTPDSDQLAPGEEGYHMTEDHHMNEGSLMIEEFPMNEGPFSSAAYTAHEEHHTNPHFMNKTNSTTLPTNLSPSQASELAAASARRWQRIHEAEQAYQLELNNILHKPTGFLSLPPEVRNTIYDFALIFPNQQCDFHISHPLNKSESTKLSVPRNFRPAVEILATCKQIHQEASSMLYGGNNFRCDDIRRRGAEWGFFAASIGRNIGMVQRLELTLDGFYPRHPLEPLRRSLMCFRDVTALKKVKISFALTGTRNQIPGQFQSSIKAFVAAQFKARYSSARDIDKEFRKSRSVGKKGMKATWKKLHREQAIATIRILEFHVLPPHSSYSPAAYIEEYNRDAEIILNSIYDQLAISVGLIKEGRTLEETGVYDWKAQRE